MDFEVSKKGMLYFTSLIKTNVDIFVVFYFCNETCSFVSITFTRKNWWYFTPLGAVADIFPRRFLLCEIVSFNLWLKKPSQLLQKKNILQIGACRGSQTDVVYLG
jgi:hypothetical protein